MIYIFYLIGASQKLGKDQKEFEADLKFGLKAVKNKYHKANTLRRKLQHDKNNEKEESEECEENDESEVNIIYLFIWLNLCYLTNEFFAN